MNIEQAGQAEQLMALAGMTNNRYGFTTGLENYCQAMWDEEGYRKAKEMRHTVDMNLFKTDREAFFTWLHDQFPPL